MKVTIIGLGLIGGSVAINLRDAGFANTIVGVDNNPMHATKALKLGLIDEIGDGLAGIDEADMVVIAIPVDHAKKILPDVLGAINDTAVVIDMGSTKQGICDRVRVNRRRGRYVATHPIAGTENTGPDAAFKELFKEKTGIICEKERSDADALATTEKVYELLGMRLTYMDAKDHDLHVAYVSHLSHVSSFMLGLTVLEIEKDEKKIFDLAGSGFESTVRLAKSSPEMWSPIFAQNSDFISQALETYIRNLQDFKTCIDNRDAGGMLELMKQANDVRDVLQGIKGTIEK